MGRHASASGGSGRRSARSSGSGARQILLATAAAACLAFVGSCSLVRPPDAKTLVAAGSAGWRTPEAAFETFRVAFGADLPELEYRSLSQDFRRREGLSYQSYRVARQKLVEENPLLALLAKAKVVESEVVEVGKRHRLIVQAGGRRFAVDLGREDRFQIYAGTTFLADGSLDFDRALRLRDAPAGQRVLLDVLVPEEDLSGVDLSQATSVVVEQTWKIERFGRLPSP